MNEYIEELKKCTVDELIVRFNADVGNPGWVGARGRFHAALKQAFLDTGLDCTDFIDEISISLAYPIKREGSRIVQYK